MTLRPGPESGRADGLVDVWSRLNPEQRIAAVASVLLIASTLGPFSFVEVAQILTAGAVLALLRLRADRRAFHLPLGDGTAIAAAGLWSAVLVITRAFDRPPGQTVLALACALLLAAAGARERVRRAPDDLAADPPGPVAGGGPGRAPSSGRDESSTEGLKFSDGAPIEGVEGASADDQASPQAPPSEPPSSRL